jgi:glycosyltransferase involved in cell wall biosynthesis
MSRAKAFVFAAEEDFGIIVVEAMACGTPVIGWNGGGVKESVVNGITGILFDKQTPKSIIDAVTQFEKEENAFDSLTIRKHSEKFSRRNFEENIRNFVEAKIEVFFGKR